jgi:hypothetical protein
MKLATIGIDTSKNVFQIHGMDEKGRYVLTKGSTASVEPRASRV